LRDGRSGQIALIGIQMLALVALASIAAPSWATLS
jgi:hypothetical protein